MRRKKLANKIMSILMSATMLVSTPMSVLATDVEVQQAADQIEEQTATEDSEALNDDADLSEETVSDEAEDEDLISDEEITSDEWGGTVLRQMRK